MSNGHSRDKSIRFCICLIIMQIVLLLAGLLLVGCSNKNLEFAVRCDKKLLDIQEKISKDANILKGGARVWLNSGSDLLPVRNGMIDTLNEGDKVAESELDKAYEFIGDMDEANNKRISQMSSMNKNIDDYNEQIDELYECLKRSNVFPSSKWFKQYIVKIEKYKTKQKTYYKKLQAHEQTLLQNEIRLTNLYREQLEEIKEINAYDITTYDKSASRYTELKEQSDSEMDRRQKIQDDNAATTLIKLDAEDLAEEIQEFAKVNKSRAYLERKSDVLKISLVKKDK